MEPQIYQLIHLEVSLHSMLVLLMPRLCRCWKGVQGKQQGMKTQPKASDNPTQVLPYPRSVWCG